MSVGASLERTYENGTDNEDMVKYYLFSSAVVGRLPVGCRKESTNELTYLFYNFIESISTHINIIAALCPEILLSAARTGVKREL